MHYKTFAYINYLRCQYHYLRRAVPSVTRWKSLQNMYTAQLEKKTKKKNIAQKMFSSVWKEITLAEKYINQSVTRAT